MNQKKITPLSQPPVKTLYISNLNYKISEKDLVGIFRKFGKINTVFIPTKDNGVHKKGIAFIQMNKAEDAQKAAKALHETILDGRTIKVVIAREDKKFKPKHQHRRSQKDFDYQPKPARTKFKDFLQKKKKPKF